MSSFPSRIWDGLGAGRTSLDAVQPPNYQDWLTLVQEIQATQEVVLKLAGNLEKVPDFTKEAETAQVQLKKLKDVFAQITPPEDLQKAVTELADKVEKADVSEDHLALRKGVQMLLTRLKAIEAGHRDLKQDIYYQLKVFANQMRNELANIVDTQEKQDKRLQGQINELQALLKDPDLG